MSAEGAEGGYSEGMSGRDKEPKQANVEAGLYRTASAVRLRTGKVIRLYRRNGGVDMGLKQQPKCKDKTCRFCNGKYCTILKQKPDVCRFYKAKEIKQ
ncbi:MAG TPA: hypothetical protein DIW36_00205 [Ruminococcaceae bacterium]|nr:hypothetical protein [Oscillospiraceae bacterium]